VSYSFAARGKDKAEAKAAVAAELDKVVQAQPIHEKDRAAAQANADALVDLLPDDESRDISVSVWGSVSAVDEIVSTITAGATASLAERLPEVE